MRRLLRVIRLAAPLLINKLVYCQQLSPEEEELRYKLQALSFINRELITYTTQIRPQEGQLVKFVIRNANDEYPIVLTRFNGKMYAFGATCTYDLETDLSAGICFGNKLYCPKHGCQFDITNGWVENPPAIDGLAIFHVEETEDAVKIYAPSVIPKKVQPQFIPRDYNDLRKVVINGTGAAAYACLSGLKENEYAGELQVITSESYPPYDRSQLSKRIKGTKPEDFYFKDPEWYDQAGVDLLLGRSVTFIHNKYSNTYVELDDGVRVAYDAFLLCTGSTLCHKTIPGIEQQPYFYFDNLASHQALKEQLKKTKNLTVLGINMQALETISTIRQEYPSIKINLIDINEVNHIQQHFGEQLTDTLFDLNQDHGVQIYERAKISEVTQNEIKFMDGISLSSDALLLFPNIKAPNTDMAEISNNGFEFDTRGRIKTDFNQRTDIKRIFAAGSCAATYYHINGSQHPGDQWSAVFNQGLTAAYNILALNIPWHQVPFEYSEHYGKVLQQVSWWSEFDTVHVIGDMKKWDFVALYGSNDYIVGAVGTPSKENHMAVIAEAIRTASMPTLSEVMTGNVPLTSLRAMLRKQNKSGCYRSSIYQNRTDFVEEFVLWQKRENFSQLYMPWVDTALGSFEGGKGTEE